MINGYLWLSGFSAMDFTQQVLLSLSEVLICKLPSVGHDLPKTIGVKLADEGGKVIVLEIVGEEVASELRGPPDNEGGVILAPRDDMVGGRIVNELVGFGEERGWY